jgi:hypothetical protein
VTTNYHQRPLNFFASIGRPLERYFTEVIRAQGETIDAELSIEAEGRLGQLDFLIDRIKELQDRFFSSPERAESERVSALRDDLIFELKLSRRPSITSLQG